MTLALSGKSSRRRAALIAAALLATVAGILLAVSLGVLGPAEAAENGTIQIHKYIPKDNPNTPWQNAAKPAFTFNVYAVDPGTNPGATPIASGTQLGSPISGLPQDQDIWLTEASTPGYVPAGFWIPETGNSQCNRQPADGSTFDASPLKITPADWTHADNKGVFHICAYNNIASANGAIDVVKVADPNGAATDDTTFSGSLSNGSSTTWGPIGFGDSTGEISLPPDTYSIAEDPPTNGWTVVGYAFGTNGACPTSATAYSLTSPSIVLAAGTARTVCVMNTKAAPPVHGDVIVKKVAQPGSISDSTTTFSGMVGTEAWSGLHIGDTSSAISLPPSSGYTLSEATPTGGWALVGFQVVAVGTVCSTDPADYTDTTVPVVAESTSVVCVMNNNPAPTPSPTPTETVTTTTTTTPSPTPTGTTTPPPTGTATTTTTTTPTPTQTGTITPTPTGTATRTTSPTPPPSGTATKTSTPPPTTATPRPTRTVTQPPYTPPGQHRPPSAPGAGSGTSSSSQGESTFLVAALALFGLAGIFGILAIHGQRDDG